MRQAELSATLEELKEEKEAEAALAEANVFEAAIAEEVSGEIWSSRVSEKQYGESRQGQENSQTALNSHALLQLPASTQSYRLQSYLGYSSPEHRREDLPDPKHLTPIKQCDISPIPDPATSPQYVPQVNQQDIKYEIGSHLTPAADTQEKCGQRTPGCWTLGGDSVHCEEFFKTLALEMRMHLKSPVQNGIILHQPCKTSSSSSLLCVLSPK
ncbi:uncharacterized protein LOC102799550 isoform X2 [Neolamprologus brichardi]|uniref:uncharacterized protein LOC102799550 isoform X2 n=1 Tax=Neolamprologus brichardi TaxID=32507 RepID=UPI0003EBFC99|nr:uncharacterized protein LOC102799550 isoform X2 [Neolamprologus brichardi]